MQIRTLVIYVLISIFFICNLNAKNENEIEVIDISQTQIRLMNEYCNSPISIRNKILTDSIYEPYKYLWNGYLGNEEDFKDWLNKTAFNELEKYNEKAKNIDLAKLNEYFTQTVQSMSEFTENEPKGKWYVFYGPKWTNLGGFDDGTMLIDLAHSSNNTIDDIRKFFPHEINHQIYSNTNKVDNDAVLNRIIDEGFACYVSYLFHEKRTTKAQELGYTQNEFEIISNQHKKILELLANNYKSNDKELANNFANRAYRFSEDYPGAIGYYIGFRIVEEYVKQNGENSWKEIYNLKPKTVLKKSKILRK